jgi:hypothetical protein
MARPALFTIQRGLPGIMANQPERVLQALTVRVPSAPPVVKVSPPSRHNHKNRRSLQSAPNNRKPQMFFSSELDKRAGAKPAAPVIEKK